MIESFSPPGGLVLDPFAGSAGVLIASRELNRRSVGIEKDPAYYQAALRRLQADRENGA